MSDFEAGINAAKSAIDFTERSVNFSNSQELVRTLQTLDEFDFSVIVLVRGEGEELRNWMSLMSWNPL